jgi:hypothetical protein
MRRITLLAFTACALVSSAAAQTIPDDTGLTALKKRLGAANAPTGAGVLVSMGEAPAPGHLPDPAHPEFAGKTMTNMSAGTGISGHATAVGQHFFGTTTSISPGITDISCYEASGFLGGGFLNGTGSTPPDLVPWKISNHSWIGAGFGPQTSLRKLDSEAEIHGLLFVGGVNNGTGPLDQPLLSHMFNGLAVGRSDGQHKSGPTGLGIDGPGRMKPELVAPAGATSFSTPLVSGACALMVQTAQTHPNLTGDPEAQAAETIKAVLMAGATHRAGWTNNAPSSGPSRGATAQPLDALWGADQVNVDKGHWILTGAQKAGAASFAAATPAPHAAWNRTDIDSGASMWWRFEVETVKSTVTVLACWNRRVAANYASWSMPDLSLELWRVDDLGQLQTLVGDPGLPYFASGNVRSTSAADNVEHLFVRDLQPGTYALELKRASDALVTWQASVAWEVVCAAPTLYGTGKLNSIGTIAQLDVMGVPSLAPNQFNLKVENAVPGQNGLAFYGSAAASIPFFGGTLLVNPPLERLPVVTLDGTGSVVIPVPMDPAWVGQERFFQFWHRDPTHPDGTGVSLSSAVQARFCH